jgi:hypothetical protein
MIMPSVGLFMIEGGNDAMISSVTSPTRNRAPLQYLWLDYVTTLRANCLFALDSLRDLL